MLSMWDGMENADFAMTCLWKINFSWEKDWITDSTAVKILRNYRPFVINLNLRGCSLLSWPSLKYICE